MTPDFDPSFAAPAEWARFYRALGLQALPAPYPMKSKADKVPAIGKWKEFQGAMAADAIFENWFPPTAKPNMGTVTGAISGRLLVVDIDDYDGGKGIAGAEWWRSATGDMDPETWCQRTGGGGRQYFFRVPDHLAIPSSYRTSIVDIRAEGGWVLLPPTVHYSGQEYAWIEHRAPWECEIADISESLLAAIVELVGSYQRTSGVVDTETTPSPALDLDAFGNIIDGRETYMRDVVWAAVLNLHRRLKGRHPTEEEGKAAHDDALDHYMRRTRTRLVGYGNIEGLERENRGPTLFLQKWRREISRWDAKVATEAAKRPLEDSTATSPGGFATELIRELNLAASVDPIMPQGGIHATPFVPIDPLQIPPRAWVYGRHYIRKFISTTVAPGGVGKTSLEVVELLCIASGRALLDVMPDERANVWLWNGEDPLEELQRRIMAAVMYFNLPLDEIVGRLFVDTGRDMPIVIATKTRDGAVISAPVVEQVVATIQANRIGVLSIDPFVACHRVSENDNSEIERVAKAWAHIADQTNCAIDLVHHVRKTNGAEVSVEDGRGAVALLSAARAARALNRMTPEEAARVGIRDPGFYFRTDNGKANLAPPASGARWFRLVSYDLQNEVPMSDTGPARPSDRVGVVTAWEWPDMTADVTATDMHAVRAKVAIGKWRADPQSSQWVGFAIMDAIGIDRDEHGAAKAKALQKMWTESRALEEYDDKDENRKTRKFVRQGPFND